MLRCRQSGCDAINSAGRRSGGRLDVRFSTRTRIRSTTAECRSSASGKGARRASMRHMAQRVICVYTPPTQRTATATVFSLPQAKARAHRPNEQSGTKPLQRTRECHRGTPPSCANVAGERRVSGSQKEQVPAETSVCAPQPPQFLWRSEARAAGAREQWAAAAWAARQRRQREAGAQQVAPHAQVCCLQLRQRARTSHARALAPHLVAGTGASRQQPGASGRRCAASARARPAWLARAHRRQLLYAA